MGENTALLMAPEAVRTFEEPETAPDRLDAPELATESVQPVDEAPVEEADEREESREETTFEVFFRAEYPRLLKAMYLVTGSRHEAEELVQDTFVRALERWDRVRAAQNRPGYVYRMAVNLYRSKLRRVARAAKKIVHPPAEPDPYQAADERDAIGRALEAIPEGQREAVVMVEWLGMTDDEVGRILGISPVTVRVRIHRARGVMRPILERGEDR